MKTLLDGIMYWCKKMFATKEYVDEKLSDIPTSDEEYDFEEIDLYIPPNQPNGGIIDVDKETIESIYKNIKYIKLTDYRGRTYSYDNLAVSQIEDDYFVVKYEVYTNAFALVEFDITNGTIFNSVPNVGGSYDLRIEIIKPTTIATEEYVSTLIDARLKELGLIE